MKQKVLITGASGFVGFHLIEAALQKGLEVYAAIRKSSAITHLKEYDIKYVSLDFTKVETLQVEFSEHKFDYIIHAAGTTKAKDQNEYNEINATYTINLITAAEKCGFIKKVVFVSSLAALGPLNDIDNLIDEQTAPRPLTSYGKSKLLAEESIKKTKLPLIVLRPTAVYGPRDKDIFIILRTFYKGMEPYIGSKAQQLSFIYVRDLAQLSVSSLFAPETANGFYNITDGKCYSRYEMADITKTVFNKKTIKFHIPLPIVKLMAFALEKSYAILKKTPALNMEKLHELTAVNWCCNIDKAARQLQFTPAYDLQKGLTETLGWYKQNNWLK